MAKKKETEEEFKKRAKAEAAAAEAPKGYAKKDGKYYKTGRVEKAELEARGKVEKEDLKKEKAKLEIIEDPLKFGVQKDIQKPEGVEITKEGKETPELPAVEYDEEGKPLYSGGVGSAESLVTDIAMGGKGLLAGMALTGWKIGGKLFFNGKKAVQTGTALKNTKAVQPLATKIGLYVAGAYGALKTIEGVAGYFTGRKLDEQQQALNTLGQITSTIVGDSKTAAGDYQKGLNELRYIKKEILALESAIKSGTIQSAAIKFNGKIYDINADIYDQLATIDEGIRDLQDFALMGRFPELDELEIQGLLRELEEEGIIDPVDLTGARR